MYVVAVIDVLGYKNIMNDCALRSRVDGLIALGNMSVQYPGGTPPASSGMVVSAVVETDAVALTYNLGAGQPFADVLWGSLHFVCHYMIAGGYVVRGGVGFGHNPSEAHTNARSIEQRTTYPRLEFQAEWDLLLPEEVRIYPPEGGPFKGLLRRDPADGGIHFDFLRFTLGRVRELADVPQAIQGTLELVRPVVRKGLSYASPNIEATANVLKKYRWYARYFNEVAAEYGVDNIRVSGCF